jgi:hypothetical protein
MFNLLFIYTIMSPSPQINMYYIQETLESFLSQCGHYYKPNKANKKKIVDLFETLPFFFYDIPVQNTLYKIIQKQPLRSFYDSNEDMKEYCYCMYEDFSKTYQLKYKPQEEFYQVMSHRLYHGTMRYKEWKKNNIHDYLFFLFLVLVLVGYIYINNINDI